MITESILRAKSDEDGQVLSVGTVLQDRYRIVRELGAGGMGAVYEAVDRRLDATVAIKQTFSVDERLRRQFDTFGDVASDCRPRPAARRDVHIRRLGT